MYFLLCREVQEPVMMLYIFCTCVFQVWTFEARIICYSLDAFLWISYIKMSPFLSSRDNYDLYLFSINDHSVFIRPVRYFLKIVVHLCLICIFVFFLMILIK